MLDVELVVLLLVLVLVDVGLVVLALVLVVLDVEVDVQIKSLDQKQRRLNGEEFFVRAPEGISSLTHSQLSSQLRASYIQINHAALNEGKNGAARSDPAQSLVKCRGNRHHAHIYIRFF